jgi:tetratricopeptide (TPR) repeat protein
MDIDKFFSDYDVAFATGNNDAIGDFLQSSLAAAEVENDKHSAVTILNEMAGFFRSISSYAQAIRYAEKALATARELGFENTIPYGTTLLNAATAYRTSGDNIKALEYFIHALGILQSNLPVDDFQLACLYNNISAIKQDTGQYAEALDMLQKAVAIMQKQPDMENDTATVMTNLAQVLLKLDRDAEAMETIEKSLELFRQENTSVAVDQRLSPHYAAALAAQGEANFRMKRYAECVRAYENALAHIKAAYGENKDYAVTSINLGIAYNKLNRADKAEECRAKGEKILADLGVGMQYSTNVGQADISGSS